jgi:Fe-Mn family superoxide dismutase
MLIMSTFSTSAESRKFTLAPLPYAYNSLEPEISEETLRYHHDKHHAAYVAKLNALIEGTPYEKMSLEDIISKSEGAIFNNAAQMWNHTFYFDTLSPTPKSAPTGALLDAIVSQYGSVDNLKKEMNEAAVNLFGSGWVWLIKNKEGKLSIMSGKDADTPLRYGMCPLLTIDVWEHAYYIDYRNARADAVKAIWNRIDWKRVEERYSK